MQTFLMFCSMALTAVAMENVVFARSLGINKSSLYLKSPKMGILYGAVFTWAVTLTSVLVSLVHLVLRDVVRNPYFQAPLYLACVCLVYVGSYMGLRRWRPKLFKKVAKVLPASVLNSALFGVFYVTSSRSFTLLKATAYALGAGIGYTLALLVIYYARKRLAISPVSRSFRGMPILLLYIGLLSLAIYGLVGHGLAA